jgi:hypothetical protein
VRTETAAAEDDGETHHHKESKTMTNDTIPAVTRPEHQAPRRHRMRTGVAAIAILGAGIGIGAAAGQHTTVRTVVVHRTTVREVPGPTITKTVPAPPPPAGSVIGTWSGTGNQVTPAFNAPASGNYIVKWTFSGNADSYGGSNFAISTTDQSAEGLGLPNVIQSSGSGSTEVTGATGASESFNVEATGSWTITVVSAP